jgi:hypothetical protein
MSLHQKPIVTLKIYRMLFTSKSFPLFLPTVTLEIYRTLFTSKSFSLFLTKLIRFCFRIKSNHHEPTPKTKCHAGNILDVIYVKVFSAVSSNYHAGNKSDVIYVKIFSAVSVSDKINKVLLWENHINYAV